MEIIFQESYNGTGALALSFDNKKNENEVVAEVIAKTLEHGKQDEKFFTLPGFLNKSNSHIILVKLPSSSNRFSLEKIGAQAYKHFTKTNSKEVVVDLQNLNHEELSWFASGVKLLSWTFDQYKTKNKEKNNLEKVIFLTEDPLKAKEQFQKIEAIDEGVALAKTVVSEPPNVLYPATYAKKAKELEAYGLEVEVLDETEMNSLGMNALLGVGQGSSKESKLVVMKWLKGDPNDAPIALVGKGVTFDTGGISLKPSANMEDMKSDMGGSAAVLGLMKSLALKNEKVNVIGVIGLVENMPSGNAQRPADVVKSMSGQTIEIINTDAEGRLVLADALWYTQDKFKPKLMINLATLTGAIGIALGNVHAGLFSNNDELAEQLASSGKDVGELLWRLPLHEEYDNDINSDIADMKNTGSGRGAGSITAAQFLQRFVNEVPWAHIDIASTAWVKKDLNLSTKGATGFGVRLLDNFLTKYYK